MAKRKRVSVTPVSVTLLILALAGMFVLGVFVGKNMSGGHKVDKSILLVNESHPLSRDYVPDSLVNLYEKRHSFRLSRSDIYLTYETYLAAQQMFAAAESEDVNGFYITSGYRSYERQQEVYAESKPGYAQKPGCSEHQTGLCFDVTAENVGGFETTRQYDWLRLNAHKYGFIQRYPVDKSHITGISYEPWHYRYVGIDAATYMTAHGLTLEEYLGQ
ncbi:MAG: M15 family metallopeptidase [Clostridiales bacterium]|nr:M15 family metallopeptidase [Clostridiales bacterium]